MTTAYDYSNQCWTTGDDAKILLRQQLHDELQLLSGNRGQDYFNFVRSRSDKTTLQEAIQSIRSQLKAL